MEGKNNKWYCRKKHRANIYSWGKKEMNQREWEKERKKEEIKV